MSPSRNGRSVDFPMPQAKHQTDQLIESLQQRCLFLSLSSEPTLEHVSHPPPISQQPLWPSQFLLKARCSFLKKNRDKLSKNHPLWERVDKQNGSLESLPTQHARFQDHVFPPKPPRDSLRGMHRKRQPGRIGSPYRKVDRSEAHDRVRFIHIQKAEHALFKSREPGPRELAGLGMAFVGPIIKAPYDTIKHWVGAKAALKMRLKLDEEMSRFLINENLILLDPRTGLPVFWEVRRCAGIPPRSFGIYCLNAQTGKKLQGLPKRTDIHRFDSWFNEEFDVA